jgi:phage minor structural protein
MVETIFILDEHLKTSKALTVNGKNNFFDDCYSMDLSTGVESYEFSTNVEDLDEKNYVMFKYHDEFKLFQITEIEQEHNEGKIITYCYGESACLELLNDVVRAFESPRSFNCIQFLQYVLEGTGWSIGNYSSTLEEKTLEVDITKTTQKWSCIQDYMSSYGYELNTRVLYENGRVVAKKLDVYEEGQLGNRTYKRFEYGRNVKGIVKKKDLYEWCTALIIDTDQDIADISFEENTYVKPAGSDVIMAKYENNHYNLGRNFIYANYEDKSSSAGEAIANALAELKRRATPCFDYECTTIMTYEEFDQISLGDTVYVVDHTFNPIVTLEARVGKLEISFSDRNNCKCNLTNYKEIKSRIKAELTGSITEILESYFPLTEDMIAGEAIKPEHLKQDTYEFIRANYIKVDIGEFEKVIAETFVAKDAYVEDLEAINGAFDNLVVKDAYITDLNATNARIEKLEAYDANVENLVANKADINELTVVKADIEDLKAIDAEITNLVNENATITNATIENLKAVNADIINLKAENADIKNLKADKADINELTAEIAGINQAVIGKLDANYFESDEAKIGDLTVGELEAEIAKIGALEGDYADIDKIVTEKIEATVGDIGALEGDIANIETILSGNLGTGNLQTIKLTANNVEILDAIIKSANIESINTDEVMISNSDGKVLLEGALLQFFDDRDIPRIQMGKDGQGNFTFVLLDETGQGVLIDETGLKAAAIEDGLIVDAMIGDDANISGSKLNINSVITSINKDGSEAIDSTKVWFDEKNQTLNMAFNELSTSNNNLQESYNNINTSVNGLSVKVGRVETKTTEHGNDISVLESRMSEAEFEITENLISSTIGETVYVSKNEFDMLAKKTESQMNQSSSAIEMSFTTSYKYTSDVETDLNNFKEEVATNIRFDENGMEIGKTNSPFKATLSNEKLAFTENDSEVAYISNKKMHITDAEVKNSLTVGSSNYSYRWNLESNGHLRLRLERD